MTSRHAHLSWLAAGFLTFILSLSGYVYYSYQLTYKEIMASVDDKLLDAALSVQHILGPDYHDNMTDLNHLSREEYLVKSKQLSDFTKKLDLEYVYAMVLIDGNVHFSASSYTAEDIKNNKITYFFDLYSEATELNKAAFYSTEPLFEYSSDQWGHFKTIFVPFTSVDGRVYLTGADITIKDLQARLNTSVSQAIITSCFFFFIAVLVAVVYIQLLKRSYGTDSATGFANHIALENTLRKSKQLHLLMAVIWVNDLEDINSFYGTKIGDTVMKRLMMRLKELSDNHYSLYRLSTNKIVVLTQDLTKTDSLEYMINQFNLNTPIIKEPFIYVTLCSGIAQGNKDLLLENAHIAAAQAKQSRHSLVRYSDSLHKVKSQYLYNVKMAKNVREAFNQQLLVPFFQPIVCLTNNEIVQYECLARIKTANNTYLKPEEFLTVINRSRMDGQLTRTMFSQCAERFRRTTTQWSINLTAQDMLDPSLALFLEDELKRYPNPSNITIELLETEAIANFAEVKAFIDQVRAKGVKVMIDDFGTGYSNISNILKLNVDGIKLDGSLVKQIANDDDVFLFIEHIASFAKQVNLQLIAESVENKLILDTLLKAGVTLMQGFYFAEPQASIEKTSEFKKWPAEQAS